MDSIDVGLVGYGYWGPNLARNLVAHRETRLASITDLDPQRRDAARIAHPAVTICDNVEEMYRDVDAVVIATPPETHCDLTLSAMRANKHVLVEKPMSTNAASANAMIDAARAVKKVLMVNHVHCYSEAAQFIKAILSSIGKLLYVDSTRINLGLYQEHCNVIWDLAVHDLSLLEYFFPHLSVKGCSVVATKHHGDQEDSAHICMDYYGSSVISHIHVNWLSPTKVRQFMIVGADKSIIWDDMNPTERVKIYECGAYSDNHGLTRQLQGRAWQMEYRRGDIHVPRLDNRETLQNVIGEFVFCIKEGKKPLTDGQSGFEVVRQLEAITKGLNGATKPVG